MTKGSKRAAPAALLTVLAVAAVVGGGRTESAQASPSTTPLVGTFTITAGSCQGASVSGSYIRMILPGGSTAGPYMSNSDSACSDQSYTLLTPGTAGGLVTGAYQPNPAPAFDKSGNAQAHDLTAPADYYGTGFATSTNSVDPQTGLHVPTPSLSVSGSAISGQLEAWSVAWNNQYFNQGAPKPGGANPGITSGPTGTFDAATGAYTLEWTSEVVGGPFNSFTGQWHLTGRFVPASSSSGTGQLASGGAGSSSPNATIAPTAASGGSSGSAPASSSGASGTAGSGGSGGTSTGSSGSSGTSGVAAQSAGKTAASGTASGSRAAGHSGPGSPAAGGSATNGSTTGGSAVNGSLPAASGSHTTVSHSGWRSPAWLIGLLAAVGVVGLAGLILKRTLWLPATVVVVLALAGLTVTSLLQATTTDRTVEPSAASLESPAGATLPAVPSVTTTTVPEGAPSTDTSGAGPAAIGTVAAVVPVPATTGSSDQLPSDQPSGGGGQPPAKSGRPPAGPTGPVTTTTTIPGSNPLAAAACPVGLPAPSEADNGGLQSLVGLVPAFGPFSAEAFAMGSAYAPVLQLLGPVLAQYPSLAPKIAPILDPLLSDWETLENAGAAVILPFYSPIREQALGYETKLAALLAPYAEKVAASAPASCVVDLEAQLVSLSSVG